MANDRKRSNPKIAPRFPGKLKKERTREDDALFNPEGHMTPHELKELANVQHEPRDRHPVRCHRR